MRAETEIVLGIRSVGDRGFDSIIESMTAINAAKKIAEFILANSMSQRFQFSIGRTKEDVLVGLGHSATNKEAKLRTKAEEIAGFIDNLFDVDAPAGGQEAESPRKSIILDPDDPRAIELARRAQESNS